MTMANAKRIGLSAASKCNTRKLRARWTEDSEQELQAMYSISVHILRPFTISILPYHRRSCSLGVKTEIDSASNFRYRLDSLYSWMV